MVQFLLSLFLFVISSAIGAVVPVLFVVEDLFHLILGGGVGLLLQQVVSLGYAPRVWFAHGGASNLTVAEKDFEAAGFA